MKLQLETIIFILASVAVIGAEETFKYEPLINPILTQFEAEFSEEMKFDVATREMGEPGEYAFWEVAAMLRDGDWNRREITSLLRQSGELGFAPAYEMLSTFHRFGQYGFSKSRMKAVRYDKLAAEAGNGPSMVNRGEKLYNDGGKRNIAEAEALFLKAVGPEALYYEGPPDPSFYNLGNPGVNTPTPEIEPVVSGSFSQKNRTIGYAHYYLGMIARDREAYEVAVSHFEDALDLGYEGNDGNHLAALQLAMAYALGDGVEKDLARSRMYLELFGDLVARSVELQRMQTAENNFIARLFYRRFSSKISEELSKEQSRMEALIATQFADEKSEFFNPEEAVRWYTFAIDQDLAWAKRSLAEFYAIDTHSTYSPEKSFTLYQEIYDTESDSMIGFNLGICYTAGFGVQADPEKGRKLFEKHAENELGAHFALTGERVFEKPLTLDEIHRMESRYADKEYPLAMALMGNRYLRGIGVRKDVERGLSLIRKSVLLDSAIGAFYLASHYYEEGGSSYSRAMSMLRRSYREGGLMCIPLIVSLRSASYKSLSANDLEPLNVFGRSGAIADAEGFEKSVIFHDEQERLLQAFLEKYPGNEFAMRLLGDNCEAYAKLESGVSEEVKERLTARAIEAFTFAAEKGNVGGTFRLGQLYYDGELVERNYTRAREYFEKAVEEEHAASNYYLGEIYRKGLGVDIDHDLAVEYYSFSGLVYASGMERTLNSMKYLVEYFTEGQHMPVDPQRAEFWINALFGYCTNDYGYFYIDIDQEYRDILRRGLIWVASYNFEHGNPETAMRLFNVVANRWKEDSLRNYARARMAEIFYTGKGARQRVSTGDLYLYEAIEQAHPAAYRVAALYHKGAGNTDRAVRYLRKAVQNGDPEGIFDYGLYRWYGYGVEADPAIAMQLFRKAAQRGSVKAMVTLAAAGLMEIDGAPGLEDARSFADQAETQGHPLARTIALLIDRKLNGSAAGASFEDELASF